MSAATGYREPSEENLLAVLYAATLLAAIVVWVILYGRGVVFRLAGVKITPGSFALGGMVVVDMVIFSLLSG